MEDAYRSYSEGFFILVVILPYGEMHLRITNMQLHDLQITFQFQLSLPTLTMCFDVTFYLYNNNCLEVPCACFTDMDFVLYELMGVPVNSPAKQNK